MSLNEHNYALLHKQMAKVAYNAYRNTAGRKGPDGNLTPGWDSLPTRLRCAWMEAAKAVCIELAGQMENKLKKEGVL